MALAAEATAGWRLMVPRGSWQLLVAGSNRRLLALKQTLCEWPGPGGYHVSSRISHLQADGRLIRLRLFSLARRTFSATAMVGQSQPYVRRQ
jgi:hypothetical protein